MAPGQPGEPVGQQAFEDLAVQHFLRREVVEQRLPADPDLGDDVVQRRAVVPVVREAGECGVEDLVAGGAALADGDVVDVTVMTVVGMDMARRTLALPAPETMRENRRSGPSDARLRRRSWLAANSQLRSLSTNVSRYAGRAFW